MGIQCCFLLYSYLGTLQTPCSACPWRPGISRSLLGLHLRPCQPALDEVQWYKHHWVVVGGAGTRLFWGHDQRQCLLPDVHWWQATPPYYRYVFSAIWMNIYVFWLEKKIRTVKVQSPSVLSIFNGQYLHMKWVLLCKSINWHYPTSTQMTQMMRQARHCMAWTPYRLSSGATSMKITAGSSRSSVNGRSSSARLQPHRESLQPLQSPQTPVQTM